MTVKEYAFHRIDGFLIPEALQADYLFDNKTVEGRTRSVLFNLREEQSMAEWCIRCYDTNAKRLADVLTKAQWRQYLKIIKQRICEYEQRLEAALKGEPVYEKTTLFDSMDIWEREKLFYKPRG